MMLFTFYLTKQIVNNRGVDGSFFDYETKKQARFIEFRERINGKGFF